jgi:hypothetical protein
MAIRKTINTLKGKRRLFLEYYLTCFNATKAAKAAGFAHPNKQGPRLLKDPAVQDAIEAALLEQTMSRNEVLARLSSQARAEYSHYLKVQNGHITINLELLLKNNLGHLIENFKNTELGPDIQFTKSLPALALIGRHYKLFTDRIEHGLDPDLEDILSEILDEAP